MLTYIVKRLLGMIPTLLLVAVVVFLFGLGLLWSSYRIFRHAEHYEYHSFGKPGGAEGGIIPKLTEGLPKDFIRTLR